VGGAVAAEGGQEVFNRLEGLIKTRLPEGSRSRLLEIKDFLGLRSDDALWSVIGALELYEQLYLEHPARIEQVAGKLMGEVRGTYEAAAAAAAAKAQASLAEVVVAASEKLARERARPLALQVYGVAAAVVTFLCTVSLIAGVELGRRGPRPAAAGPWIVARAVLSAPAGWLLFAFLLPIAVVRIRRLWEELGESRGWRTLASRWVRLGSWVLALAGSLGVLAQVAWER